MFQEDIDDDLLEAAKEVENQYQEFFRNKLKEYGVESPNDLSYDEKKKFFDEVEKDWASGKNSKNENTDEEKLNEGFNDVYANIYNNLISPQINKVGDIITFPYDGYDTSFEIKLIVEPVKFGDKSNYYIKALNGPHKGNEIVLPEDYINDAMNNNINESNEQDVIDILDEIVGQNDKSDYNGEEIVENDDLDKLLNLKESTDFDVTNIDNDVLEKILKMFLDKKAEDGEDYELASRGKKLILKIYNNNYVENVKKLLK